MTGAWDSCSLVVQRDQEHVPILYLQKVYRCLSGIEVCWSTYDPRVREVELCHVSQQTDSHMSMRTSSKQSRYIRQAMSSKSLAFKPSGASNMSEPSINAIENYATSTNPYIRGHCDEICDHLLMFAEAYKPPTVKAGDLESKFPGYARGAQEASEIFEAWSDHLDFIADALLDFEGGVQTVIRRLFFLRCSGIFLTYSAKTSMSEHLQEVWREHTHIISSRLAIILCASA
jgi:hypothetical protein